MYYSSEDINVDDECYDYFYLDPFPHPAMVLEEEILCIVIVSALTIGTLYTDLILQWRRIEIYTGRPRVELASYNKNILVGVCSPLSSQ